jgi:hypothetical protein
MKIFSVVAALLLLIAPGATAQTTNGLSDAEIQGRVLAQSIIQQRPATNFSQAGNLMVRDAQGTRHAVKIICEGIVYPTEWRQPGFPTNWQSVYQALSTNHLNEELVITHESDLSNRYYHHLGGGIGTYPEVEFSHQILPGNVDELFANSDFTIGDLGLEFLHWPQQKVLKREVHRSCGCTVLESTNPDPSPDGYSRVASWIDTDTLGIVEAYAYDAKGKQLKDFYPKDFTKVNGRWQVQTLVMENVQTGSRSRLEFDLKK